MGQASSRQRASQQPTGVQAHPRNPVTADTSTSHNDRLTTETTTTTTKRSRRASLRRSILGFIPSSSSSSSSPSSSNRSRKDSNSSNSDSSQSLRKRWRSSRRFSKAPAHLTDLTESAQQSGVPDADREVVGEGQGSTVSDICSRTHNQSQAGPSNSSATSRSSTPHLVVSDNDKSPKQGGSAASRTDSQPLVSAPPLLEPTIAAPTRPTTEEIRREVAEFLSGQVEEPSVPPSSDSDNTANNSLRELPSANGDTNNNPQASPQHFPPPGTLVVVQGVVNTTDSPHTAASHTHNAVAPSNPLPTAVPSRPSSAFSSPALTQPVRRRASSVSTSHPSSRMPSSEERNLSRSGLSSFIRAGRGPSEGGSHAHTASVPDADMSSYRSASDSSTSMIDSTPSTTDPEIPSNSTNENASTSRGLSPGSIDVLGTLLSVAAAATAASLFSSGLSQNHLTNPPSPQSTARPLSPTPTAGLGALGGMGGLAGLGLNPPSIASATAPQDGRDRIRNVWESIRERVGLNSRTAGPSDRPSGGEAPAVTDTAAPSTPGDRDRMRPSEMMLAEMARALNAGLGLAGNSNNNSNSNNSINGTESRQGASEGTNNTNVVFPPTVDSGGALPPEGSFERFLANLQSDLRTILSEEPIATQDPAPTSSTAEATNTDPTPGEARAQALAVQATNPDDAGGHDRHEDDPPALENDSDSESDHEFQDVDDDASDDASVEDPAVPDTLRTATPMPSAGGILSTQDQPSTPEATAQRRRERPVINLWRLYRFDPIPANHAGEHATRTSTGTAPLSVDPDATRSSDDSSLASSPTPESSGSPPEAATSSSLPSATVTPSPNVVVPVIVVGLQSVDVVDHDEPEDELAPAQHAHAGPSTPTSIDPTSADGVSNSGGSTTPRGRTWPSRAANALRTWRPGRRGSTARRNADGTGSRTFLIYVIGGYYPPNHHMVTGSDNLDSYEALWELAELLGQVKPPTATREDIDNSGLQIIKASDLSRYEQEGKISSNCVDRCLVCLDDYEPEQELRVMKCRHAFHKECVDKWLTVGRNNCPACRTKGVNVPGDPPPPSSEPAAA